MAAQQTFENHAKVVPAYHYFTFGLIAAYLVYRLYIAATAFSLDALMSLLLAVVALLMVFFWARLFALRVQDRVIRLEMRLRAAAAGARARAAARRVHHQPAVQPAVRQRRGAAGAGREGAGRQARRSQGHQAHDPRLAGGSAPRVVPCAAASSPLLWSRSCSPRGLVVARRRRSGSSTRRQACRARPPAR